MLPLILYAANNCIGLSFAMHTHGRLPDNSRPIFLVHTEDVHAPRLLFTRPHRLYINHVVRRDHSSPGRTNSTSTTSCAVTTRRPVCTGSTAPTSCIRTRRLDARLLVSRSHYLSPCAQSLRLAARLLCASPLDLLSGRAGSTSATPCVATTCLTTTSTLIQVLHTLPRHRLPAHRADHSSRLVN
jgi:hypothetical protein